MGSKRRSWRAVMISLLTAAALAGGTAAATAATASGRPAVYLSPGHHICDSSASPALAASLTQGIDAALGNNFSRIAIEVQDPRAGVGCWLNSRRHYDSASVVKATILGALLRKVRERHRWLTTTEQNEAWLMITESDNNAATYLWNDVGMHYLQRFLDLAGMSETVLGQDGYWGLTQITAHDETLLLELLTAPGNRVLTSNAKAYELDLMAHVIASERWGVSAGAPSGYTLHIKNGWAPLPYNNSPWFVNSIGTFTHRTTSYSIVILTSGNATMTGGVNRIQRVAAVINHDLNPNASSYLTPSAPSANWGIPDEQAPLGRQG